MDGYGWYIFIAASMGFWLLLFLLARFTPLSKRLILLKKYWGLYIPLLSWVFTVFPLVLPPIPLGPIALSFAWSRRRLFPSYKQGCEHLGKVEQKQGCLAGYLVNFFINVLDLLTLGLAQLFATALLLREMIRKCGTEAERAESDPVSWCTKWLLLGNVVFLAIYLVAPGYIFAPLVQRMENHFVLHPPAPQPPEGEGAAGQSVTGQAPGREGESGKEATP